MSASAALAARVNRAQRVVLAVHFNVSRAFEWAERGLIQKEGPVWHRIVTREQSVLTNVDGRVFVSEFVKAELTKWIPGIGAVPRAVIPNFVRAAPSAPAGSSLPGTDLVGIESLEPRKNQSYLLDIIAQTHRKGAPVSLTLIGDGPDRLSLVARATELGIARLVHFAGFISEAGKALRRHRALIHAARMENLPTVLIEAMSQGLPAFAPAVGGTGELFDDGVEGWRLPLEDSAAAADVIIRNLNDPHRLRAAAEAAQRRFASCYDASLVGERLRQFLMGCGGRL